MPRLACVTTHVGMWIPYLIRARCASGYCLRNCTLPWIVKVLSYTDFDGGPNECNTSVITCSGITYNYHRRCGIWLIQSADILWRGSHISLAWCNLLSTLQRMAARLATSCASSAGSNDLVFLLAHTCDIHVIACRAFLSGGILASTQLDPSC
jgi:hypothetical protein